MLSAEELEAMPLGSTVYNLDGDELIRVEEGWMFAEDLNGQFGKDMPPYSHQTVAGFRGGVTSVPVRSQFVEDFRRAWPDLTEGERTQIWRFVHD